MDRNRIDSEYLIEAIKKHPSIWNKDCKVYHNKGFKENSWSQVGEELLDNWHSLSENEKMVKIYDFKKRWGNIRDYYKKDVALQMSGQIGTASKRKKYVFSKQLEFLKPFLLNKSGISGKDETEDGQADDPQYLEASYSSDSESSFPLRRKNAVKIEEKSPDETREWNVVNALEKKIESELLIEVIKKHECIWNKNSKNYHRKNRKEHSWNQVCEELMDNWNSYNEDEKFNRKYELKKRWSNIRDYYKKDVALQLSGKIGQPAMKRQKYVFSNQLEFLRPFFDKSFTYDPSEQEDQEQVYLEQYSSDTDTSTPLKRPNSERTLEIAPMVTVTDNETFEEDGDYLFLKSLVPDMKAMTREQKVDFKMGVLQLYKNIMCEKRHFEDCDSKNPLQ